MKDFYSIEFDGEKIFVDRNVELDFTGGEGSVAAAYLKIKPGEIFFDVGASWAMWTLFALSKGAGVYAFEPSKPYFEGLVEYIEANPDFVGRCKAYRMGLGNKEEIGTLAEWYGSHGWHGELTPDCFIQTPMKRLDSFLPELDRLDWMKLDVEGGEYDILLGGKETLEKYKPNLIIENHINVDQIGAWMAQNNIVQKMIDIAHKLNLDVIDVPHQGRSFLICTKEPMSQ